MPPKEPPPCRTHGSRAFAERRAGQPIHLRSDHAVRTGPSDDEDGADEDGDARVRPDESLDEQHGHQGRGDRRGKVRDCFGEQTRRPGPAAEGGDENTGDDAGKPCDENDR